jgi:outer membrane protein assembly factor BamD (BamD/ComL family)
MAEQRTAEKSKSNASLAWVYVIALVISLCIIGAGIHAVHQYNTFAILGVGFAGLIAVLVTWPLAAQLRRFHEASCGQAEQALRSINERFEEFSIMINLISEQQLLSDRAKAVAFREKDSDALRRAIQDEMLKQNWEVAASLANEMETAFGYKQEADRLRLEIEDRHQEVIRKQVNDAIAVIDRHIRAETWDEAIKEAQKTARLYSSNPQAVMLPQEVENRRQAHKKQLIDAWNDAVTRHDVDGAIEILKRLDLYLTPTEAEAYQETARSIFKEKIGILRTQFSVAVQDHKWTEALRLGEQITADFPNSQMAKEVREMIPTLKARAAGLEPAQV